MVRVPTPLPPGERVASEERVSFPVTVPLPEIDLPVPRVKPAARAETLKVAPLAMAIDGVPEMLPEAPRARVPALTVVAPVKVLLPFRVSEPVPLWVSLVLPRSRPLKVVVAEPVRVRPVEPVA